MKRIICIAMACVAIFACNRMSVEVTPFEANNEQGTYIFTLTATAADELTKTAYADEKTFSWSANDEISVVFHKTDDKVDGDDIIFVNLKTTAGGTTASFTGTVPNGYEVGASDTEGGVKWALFPAGDHVWDGTNHKPKFVIPDVTDFTVSGAHFSVNIPMAAKGDGENNFVFNHIACAYKISFKELDATKVKLKVTHSASHKLSGTFSMESSNGGLWAQGSSTESDKSVSFIRNVAGDHTVDFYFTIPRYGESSGFQPTITLTDETSGYTLYQKTAKQNWTATDGLEPAYDRMVILPAIPASGVGKPFTSAFLAADFNWADVDMDPATPTTKDAFPGDGTKMISWKAYSDATNVYFFFQLSAAKVKDDGQYSAYLATGFDTAEGGADASYGLGGGFEARALSFPFHHDAKAPITFQSTASPKSESTILCPLSGESLGKVATNGACGGAYAFVEICIPRAKIGNPTGEITVRHAYGYTASAAQTITLAPLP